ncbi:Outer envelope pore protein 37 chloroplastic [Euphorbia peplus]|nr:Outer envelope pore protein 37 chloroplastic [Euphorbia peplus]
MAPPPLVFFPACVPTLLERRPAVRVTSKFDSLNSCFLNKVSCKLFDNLAKLNLTFQNDDKGQVSVLVSPSFLSFSSFTMMLKIKMSISKALFILVLI